MTKEAFSNLSIDAQEKFINEGGTISTDNVQLDSSNDLVQTEQVAGESTCTQLVLSTNLQSALPSSTDDGIMIENPVALLFLIDEGVRTGQTTLHPWQVEFMMDFANTAFNDEHPFQAVLRAANGSGKDKYIIAACCVWLCMRWKRSKGVVTSASGVQLDVQTCVHIKTLCDNVNTWLGVEMWDCKYRQYTMTFGTKEIKYHSFILCYATDEPKKAEGYHPTDKGTKMAIFLSEDKTVPDDINIAINKCTGYTHRVHASTPGLQLGHFYDLCQLAVMRDSIKSVMDVQPTDWIQYHVPASKCPHLKQNYILQMERDLPGGKNGAAYKSQIDAEFGQDSGEMNVIPFTYIWQAKNNTFNTSWIEEEYNTGGLDLADGGAETCLVVRNGNKHLKTIPFKFDNSDDTYNHLIQLFNDNGLNNPKALIFADNVGIGKPTLDRLRKAGWSNIRFVDGRGKASRPTVFKNRNAEVWFHMKDLFVRHNIIIQKDEVLCKQLGSRHYKLVNGLIHQMLTKLEERSRGFVSPDRADALNYCFWNYVSTYTDETVEELKPVQEEEIEQDKRGDFTMKGFASSNNLEGYVMRANFGIKKQQFRSLERDVERYNKKVLSNN